ncbi:MAG: DUF1848 family protein [Deltaproteobacteria bacterium]|nr:DUF1848 family protein [Deltaproteobacteria bacterium]
MSWSVAALSPEARVVSASRRTDIPALYGRWFGARLDAGGCTYVPAGPPRTCRASLRPEDVRWFVFWTRWPRPFLPVLDTVLARRFPVIVNLTVTALGGTAVEPGGPPARRALTAARALADRLPRAALTWRYDPIFLSDRYDEAFHLDAFARLAEDLAGRVDHVVVSFVTRYGRRVAPDLARWEIESGDRLADPSLDRKVALVGQLEEIARAHGLPLAACCDPALTEALGLPPASCNGAHQAPRAWPELATLPLPRRKPGRPGCTCVAEVDIGVYDTCTLGCRYSYGSKDQATARARARRHDPDAPCLVPEGR